MKTNGLAILALGILGVALPSPATVADEPAETAVRPARDFLEPAGQALPHLSAAWKVSLLPEHKDHRAWMEALRKANARPVELPAFVPVAHSGRVFFRTYDGFHQVNLRESEPDSRHSWQTTDGGAAAILGDPNTKAAVDRWRTVMPWDNTVFGTLSSDGVRAFLVDDLLLPAPADALKPLPLRAARPRINDLAHSNNLQAYNLESMKLVWRLGGNVPCGNDPLDQLLGLLDAEGKRIISAAPDAFFLGPPLCAHGKLYVLHERKGEIRVLCLECHDKTDDRLPPPPDLVWSRKVVRVADPLPGDIPRRAQAVQLAAGEGVLVCPTHSGALTGINLRDGQVLWQVAYRSTPAAVRGPTWHPSAPLIHEGKVFYSDPEDSVIRCLDVSDGRSLWNVDRGDAFCMAGIFDDELLLLGARGARMLRLIDGATMWDIDLGTLSGRGVALGRNCYLVPLRESRATGKPGLCALCLPRRRILGQTASAKGEVPGNLLFCEDGLISQTSTEVTCSAVVPLRTERDINLYEAKVAELWEDLRSADAVRATTATWLLAASAQTVDPLLQKELRSVPAPDAKKLAKAVADLSSREFAVRRQADQDLEAFGELAESVLRGELAEKPGLEVQRRLERLLAKIDEARKSFPAETVRLLRAVKVLELANSARGRELLEELSKGAPDASLTRSAKASFELIGRRPAP